MESTTIDTKAAGDFLAALVLESRDLDEPLNLKYYNSDSLYKKSKAALLKNKTLMSHDLREEGSTLLALLDDFTNLSEDK